MTIEPVPVSRRAFLFFVAGGITLAVKSSPVAAAMAARRILSLHHKWSGEKFVGAYAEDGRYLSDALAEINHLFRDRYCNEVRSIDVKLLDLLHEFKIHTGYCGSVEIVCGYRTPATNMLLLKRDKRVAKASLHMEGKAVDVRFEGLSLAKARQAAICLRAGGVGYYPKRKFIHLDVGSVRSW
jgi:uncharacterized protein YcbK (DUF882 family)